MCKKVTEYFSLSRRVRTLLSVSLLAFGLFVFVPWSVYFGNSSQFPFIFQDFVNWNLRILAIFIVIVSVVLLVTPPIISDYFVAAISGLGLCVYLQAMFMNQYLGTMDGIEPVWSEHRVFGIINLVIWIVIVISPFVLRKIAPSHFSTIISLAAGIVLFLELIATVFMVVSSSQKVWSRADKYYADGSNQFQLSKENNVVVFIFDNLGIEFIKLCFEDSPETKDIVKDFIWFDDARSNYNETFPALYHELTGTLMQIPAKNSRDLFEKSWHSSSAKSFYKQIRDVGYDARLYTGMNEAMLGPADLYHDLFSNIQESIITYTIDYKHLHTVLMQISAFSAAPYLAKKHFYYSFDLFGNIVQVQTANTSSDREKIPLHNDTLFEKMVSCGIETSAEKPVLAFYYTEGTHAPRYVDEKCNRVNEKIENPVPTTKSCFYILSEFIKLLKEKDIYDKTAILVISDHGSHEDLPGRVNPSGHANPYDMSFMLKPFDKNKAELSINKAKVQSLDVLPTLLHVICGNNADFKDFEGYSAFNVPNDRIRKVYRGGWKPGALRLFALDWDNRNANKGWYQYYEEYIFVDADSFEYGTESKSFVRTIPIGGSLRGRLQDWNQKTQKK